MGCCASDDRGASKANMDGQKKGTTAGPRPAVFSNRNFATLFAVEHLPSLRFFEICNSFFWGEWRKNWWKILLSDEIWSLPKCLNLNSQRGKMVFQILIQSFFFSISLLAIVWISTFLLTCPILRLGQEEVYLSRSRGSWSLQVRFLSRLTFFFFIESI